MTYKEFVECARPELVSDQFEGGVYGCPFMTAFKDGAIILTGDCYAVSDNFERKECNKCWNIEMNANETARAIELYGSEWFFSALAYLEEKKHDSTVQG